MAGSMILAHEGRWSLHVFLTTGHSPFLGLCAEAVSDRG